MRLLAKLFLLIALTVTARADVKLHPLFTDNMVLQREAKVPVWGTADPGEKFTVSLSVPNRDNGMTNQVAQVTADDKGNWSTHFETHQAAVSAQMRVQGANSFILKNLAVGDVWLCSGQSNMEWKLNQLSKNEQGRKVADSAGNDNIRLFTVPNVTAMKPRTMFPVSDREGKWLPCTPENAFNFSAVGYFFGRDLQKHLSVPIGLISADWGGTPAQAWTSLEGLQEEPVLKDYVLAHANTTKENEVKAYSAAREKYEKDAAKAKAEGKKAPLAPRKPMGDGENAHTPTVLYNGMIAPLVPFKIKGAIWYQGESNASKAKEYRTLFPAMIRDWRKKWGEEIPFFAVQLAPFQADGSEKVSYAELRDAQTFATKKLTKVGMAVITDAGEEKNIHPQSKAPVGARLALSARAIAYGESVEYSGPVFKEMKVDGSQVVLGFDHLGGGLEVKGDALTGFTMCGENQTFHAAKAVVKGNKVVVTCDKVTKPVAVRFGWVNFAKPELNFFNKAGLPAVPFRTDEFPLTTN